MVFKFNLSQKKFVNAIYYLRFINNFFVMASVVVEELEHYIAMAKAQFKVAKKSLTITKTKKDEFIVDTQKVQWKIEIIICQR